MNKILSFTVYSLQLTNTIKPASFEFNRKCIEVKVGEC